MTETTTNAAKWHVRQPLDGCKTAYIRDASGQVVASATPQHADIIVRAVNAHEQLLAACKAADRELSRLGATLYDREKLRNAIAAAEAR